MSAGIKALEKFPAELAKIVVSNARTGQQIAFSDLYKDRPVAAVFLRR